MSEYLTREEVAQLTGTKQRLMQGRWLCQQLIPYDRVDGWAMVRRADLPTEEPPQPVEEYDPESERDYFVKNWRKWWLSPARIEDGARRVPTPIPEKPGVYFIFVRERIVYVGQSNNLARRVWEHRKNKEIPVHRVNWIVTPKAWMTEIESFYLALYEPPLNIQGPRNFFMYELAQKLTQSNHGVKTTQFVGTT